MNALIDDTVCPGVVYVSQFVSHPEVLLHEMLETAPWDDRWHARRTASFGVPYDHSGITYAHTPLPLSLESVGEAISARFNLRPNSCLLNHYRDGNGRMGFHVDGEELLEPGAGIVIVSLGAERTLQFRLLERRSHVVSYRLASGSILHIPSEVQQRWQHGLPAEPESGERISLTFRRLLVREEDDVD